MNLTFGLFAVFWLLGIWWAATLSITPVQASLFVGISYGICVGLCLYGVLLTRRHALTSDAHGIRAVYVWTSKAIEWNAITNANWEHRPNGGSVLLSSVARHRIRIHFSIFSVADRVRLALLLKEKIPPELHHGWIHFASRCLPKPRVEITALQLYRKTGVISGTLIGTAACVGLIVYAKLVYDDTWDVGWLKAITWSLLPGVFFALLMAAWIAGEHVLQRLTRD